MEEKKESVKKKLELVDCVSMITLTIFRVIAIVFGLSTWFSFIVVYVGNEILT